MDPFQKCQWVIKALFSCTQNFPANWPPTLLKIYRSNRAEWLAQILAEKLRLDPPDIFEQIEVVVNTWPTSRWLGEQLAIVNGVNALVKFPFPGSRLRELVKMVLGIESHDDDPWRASNLVWPLLDLFPDFLQKEEALPLRQWLEKHDSTSDQINRAQWQLVRGIADAFDDYALYRPQLIQHWIENTYEAPLKPNGLSQSIRWQAILIKLVAQEIKTDPFGIQVRKAIKRLKEGNPPVYQLPRQVFFFGLSSLAPIQIELIQALSGVMNIQIFLLTPCPDLWQRCRKRRESLGQEPATTEDIKLLLEAPLLEATLGRMGSEFQQLLEGSGESQLGEIQESELFAAPANIATELNRSPTLLEQIQQRLVTSNNKDQLTLKEQDTSLVFIACPGQLREVQLVRDQILQWFANDPSLEPKDVLIMTPKIRSFAPLIASVFNDVEATGVEIPWRITDRTQQDNPGLTKWMLQLLELANTRLTITKLESLLSNPAIEELQKLSQEEARRIIDLLQRTGFTWGLNAKARNGDETHSLQWCLDRWLLGLVFPSTPGLSPGGAAPFSDGLTPPEVSKWWKLLSSICKQLEELRHPHSCERWIELLKTILNDFFGEGGTWYWERQSFLLALEDWRKVAGKSHLKLEAAVTSEILEEALSQDSGRFGHRSGALTISALEPMRAIPHRVIVLMGLDSDVFPRHRERQNFHLLEHHRQLGDPCSSDQDRYVLLEGLMSSRQHLLITWNCRVERTGEVLPAATPVSQWLNQLKNELGNETYKKILREPDPNPLSRKNFVTGPSHSPISCDRRNLEALHLLKESKTPQPLGLALPLRWKSPTKGSSTPLSDELLERWLIAPQLTWLEQHLLKPREWIKPLEELEALDLEEWQQFGLIKKHLDELLNQAPPDEKISINELTKYDWDYMNSGQGILSPKSAGLIESEQLSNRWLNLKSALFKLGPLKTKYIPLSNGSKKTLWSGKFLLEIQHGKLTSKSVIKGWLSHLQACANGLSPSGTVVIAGHPSKTKRFEYENTLCWNPLTTQEAKATLKDLAAIASIGLQECWPIPPESGWALAEASQKSTEKAATAFTKKWMGGFKVPGERDRAEMQICFGVASQAAELLNSQGFNDAFKSLYSPILKFLI